MVATVLAFTALGWWQWESAQAAERARTRPVDATPVELAALVGPGRPLGDAVGRTVVVSGRYDAEQQVLVPGRKLDGRTGAHVLIPLLIPNGAAVPVRRGWVAGPEDGATAVPPGTITVTGVLQPS